MKNMSLKIKLTIKYAGFIFGAACIALLMAAGINGKELAAVGKTALVLLPLILLASLAAGYLLVRETLQEVEEIAKSATAICKEKDFSKRIEREVLDDELTALIRTYNGMLDEVEEAMRKETKFTASVAQEMWTPISVILIRSEACLDDWRLSERQRWQIEIIQRRAQNVSDLLFQMLFLARADQGCQPISKKRSNVSELTRMIVEEQRAQLEDADSSIQLEYEIEPEIYAEIDETFYMRMLLNLLANAVDYSREDGPVKVIVERKKTVSEEIEKDVLEEASTDDMEGTTVESDNLKVEQSEFVCRVEDAGIGISEEDLPHIWERFYRGDTSRTGGGHFGLGLSIVQWIAKVHGGWVDADSILGAGSCFMVGLPCEAEPKPVEPEQEEDEGEEHRLEESEPEDHELEESEQSEDEMAEHEVEELEPTEEFEQPEMNKTEEESEPLKAERLEEESEQPEEGQAEGDKLEEEVEQPENDQPKNNQAGEETDQAENDQLDEVDQTVENSSSKEERQTPMKRIRICLSGIRKALKREE